MKNKSAMKKRMINQQKNEILKKEQEIKNKEKEIEKFSFQYRINNDNNVNYNSNKKNNDLLVNKNKNDDKSNQISQKNLNIGNRIKKENNMNSKKNIFQNKNSFKISQDKKQEKNTDYNQINLSKSFSLLKNEILIDNKSNIENNIIVSNLNFIQEKNKNNLELLNKIKELSVNAIITCQNFIRDKYDKSSVSLREVRRFIIFYEWFVEFLERKKKKNDTFEKFKYESLNEESLHKYAINLSIYICYYIRIFNKEYRKQLKEKMNVIFSYSNNKKEQNNDFEYLPLLISRQIANEVELEEGIAQNRALLDNLFALFVCITNKIPLFICGKPGCSKSLSVQLIFKSMIGEASNSKFFKYESKILRHSYQGSLTSTSAGILKIFNVARKAIKNKNLKNTISVIYFDEMGLAEISPNNPLKVIHSQLEYDENEDKVAFVGISNWTLDASKMNRGIYLSIPEPDEKDLIETAQKISQSYGDELLYYKEYINELAKSYYLFKESYKDEIKNKDFHGTRDFYNLIKITSKQIKNAISQNKILDENTICNILNNSIERNFGGLPNSVLNFKSIIHKKYTNINNLSNYDVKKAIQDNIDDNKSRYLLLITKTSISEFLINSILENLKKEINIIYYIGSKFEKDLKEENYSATILNKIQYTVNQENVMVLRNLDSIYPSLYDLFNQNFIKAGRKSYARISLGYSKTHTYYVNDNFKCVVLLDSKDIEKQDPPFLNRFEKHIVSFDVLLEESLMELSKELSEMISDLIKSDKELSIDLSKELINCDLEEIQGIIYKNIVNDNSNKNINIYINKIIEKIAPTLSQDVIAFAKNFLNDRKIIFDKILNIYKNYKHNKLTDYLENINSTKHVIYTFSNIFEYIFGMDFEKTIKNKKYNKTFKKENSIEIYVQDCKSEREIEEQITLLYENKNKNLCIFHFKMNDCVHINHINYLITNYENQKNIIEENQKVVLFIIHIKRYLNKNKTEKKGKLLHQNNYLLSHIIDYPQVFIDNINGKDFTYIDIIKYNTKQFLEDQNFIILENEFNNKLLYGFSLINYKIENNYESFDIKEHIDNCCKFIQDNENKISIIEVIKKQIIENETNIFNNIFYSNVFEEKDIDLISVISRYLSNLFELYLNKTIIKIERNGALFSLLSSNDFQIKEKGIIFRNYLKNIDLEDIILDNNVQKNDVTIILGLSFPTSLITFNNIQIYIESIKKEFLTNESFNKKNNENEYITKYMGFINNIKIEFEKQPLIELLRIIEKENIYPPNLEQNLIKDYLMIYLKKYKKTTTSELKVLINITNIFYKNENENEKIEIKLSKIILFFEGYSKIFYSLFDSLQKCLIFFPNFYEELIINIQNNADNDNESKSNIYIILESLIICIINGIQNFNYKADQNGELFHKMIIFLKEISNNLIQFNIEFNLYLNQLYTLLILIKVQETLEKNGKSNPENINEYINNVKDQFEKIASNDENIAIQNLQVEYNFLRERINNKHFPELINEIFSSRFIQIKKKNYRGKMLELIINDNNILLKSHILLCYFFLSYNLIPLNENNKKKCIESFTSIYTKKTEIGRIINNSKNEILDEVLLYLFETKINSYFYEIKKKSNQIFNISFEYFKKSVEFIEAQKNMDNKIGIFYSIAYIKSYLLILSDVIYDEKKNQEININEINQFLNSNKNPFKKVLKLYILKCINILKLNSFDDLLNFNFIFHQITWFNEFNLEHSQSSNLDFLFINIENIEKYKQIYKQFINDKNINFTEEVKTIQNLIKTKEGLNLFYDVSINEIISNLCNENYQKDSQIYSKYTTYVQIILEKIKLSDFTNKLLNLFYKFSIFNEKMAFMKNMPINIFEMLLYSHKIAFICSQGKQNSFYQNLISPKVIEIINKNYIPGGEPNDDKRIMWFQDLEEFLIGTNDPSQGAYICSCGFFYSIPPCGLPTETKNCPICKKKIGGLNHKLIEREGHIRIYLKEEQKKIVERRKYFKPLKSKLLPEYKKDIEQLKNLEEKGFKKVNLDFFLSDKKDTRKLSKISYRLLNFIFYSCIYYAKILEFLNDEDIKKFLLKDEEKDLTWILNENWNLLKKELVEKGINNIQIFLNVIFEKLSKIIYNSNNFEESKFRKEFEDKINKLIEENVQNYKNSYDKYIKINNEILKINNNSIKSILQEIIDPRQLDQNNYPFIRYFTVPKYPNENDFWEAIKLVDQNTVSVINAYKNNYFNIEKLQNILLMNPFENYALMKYSNNITRKEAKKILIKKELELINDENITKLYNNFEKGYNSMSDNSIKYECKTLNKVKIISQDDPIAYILNDNGELDYGMYIAAAYYSFTEYQNTFLNSALLNIDFSELKYFKNQINNEILPQQATSLEVVNNNISNDIISSFYQLISSYSYRNCFNNNKELNFVNYRDIKYDFNKIEVELGKMLLVGKRKFSTDQEFIIYAFEGYIGKNSNAIQNFIDNYHQIKLTKAKKERIKNEIQVNEYRTFLVNLQILIFYYQNKKNNIKEDDSIQKAIENLPQFVQKSEIVIKLLKNYFINEIIDIYEFIEYLSYDIIKGNVVESYKIKLNLVQIKKLNDYFNNKQSKIKKKSLATTVRKYISRYLSGEKQVDQQNENENLFFILKFKPELWDKKITENEEDFFNTVDFLSENISIKVYNSVDLYEELKKDGEEDIAEGIEPIKMYNETNENIEEEEQEDFDIIDTNKINYNRNNAFDEED